MRAPRPTWLAAAAALLAVGCLVLSLAPAAAAPAWPAVSLGGLAVVLAWGRGRALPRALVAWVGALAGLAGLVQIASLWTAAWACSYM